MIYVRSNLKVLIYPILYTYELAFAESSWPGLYTEFFYRFDLLVFTYNV